MAQRLTPSLALTMLAHADPAALLNANGIIAFALIILMKITLFVIGYKVIRLGYNLISAGAKGEFKFKSTFAGMKADLTSVSPGLLFVLLGALLCIYGIVTEKSVKTVLGVQTEESPPVVPSPKPHLEDIQNNTRKD